jgi:hypothetical protein
VDTSDFATISSAIFTSHEFVHIYQKEKIAAKNRVSEWDHRVHLKMTTFTKILKKRFPHSMLPISIFCFQQQQQTRPVPIVPARTLPHYPLTASGTGIKITQPPPNASSVKTVSVTGLPSTSLTVKSIQNTVKAATTLQGAIANKTVVSIKQVVSKPSQQTVVQAVTQVVEPLSIKSRNYPVIELHNVLMKTFNDKNNNKNMKITTTT